MKCADCQDLLVEQLDGLDPIERSDLDLHLASCPACRDLHGTVGRMQRSLRLLTLPAPPPDLSNRIAARLLHDYAARRRFRRRLTAFAAAAAVLVALSARWFWGPSRPAITDPGLTQLVTHDPPGEVTPNVRDSVSEVSSVVVSAANRTADATVAQSRLLLPLVPSTSLPSLEVAPIIEGPTMSLREAGQGVSEGLTPVTDSAKRAFDLFLRELPPMNLDQKPGL